MAGTSAVKTELVPVSLKSVYPVIPRDDDEKVQLIEDLGKMGCEGLLVEPWEVKSEAMVQEFQVPRSNEWEGTIRRDPTHWTPDLWAEVYGFRKEGRMRARRTETWIDGKFKTNINPKDGHLVSDCINPREKRVLEFIILILYPEKLGRVTKEIGNTVFGALKGEYLVSWGMVIHEVVDKLVSVLGKKKPTPVSPYLFHFYSKNECLRKEEMQQIEVARECLALEVAPETDPDVVELESDEGSLSPVQMIPERSPRSRIKTTFRSPKGKSPVRNPDWKDLSNLEMEDEPFKRVLVELYQVQSNYGKMAVVIRGASKLLGDCKAGNISKEIRKLKAENPEVQELKAHSAKLKLKIADLDTTVKVQDEQNARLRAKEKDMDQIRATLSFSGDTLNKAHLFEGEFKTEGHLSAPKIVAALVKFGHRMDDTLAEMRKLLPGTPEAGTSQPAPQVVPQPSPSAVPPPAPPAATTPTSAGKVQQALDEWKERILERQQREQKMEGPSTVVPEGTPKVKKPESRAASSEPASQRSGKKNKVPPPEEEEEEEESTEEDSEDSEGEDEPATPPPPPKTKPNVNTRSSKKAGGTYNSPYAPKRTTKRPAKGEGSNKKPRGK